MTNGIHDPALQCAEMIRKANNIVLFSGAGMSTAAGIPDFRGPNGIYKRAEIDNPELIFEIGFFRRDPSLFYRFYKEFLSAVDQIKPTFAHRFFAALEAKGKLQGVVTQNIDSLHQAAGSRNVLEIHGGIWDNYCMDCRTHHSIEETTALAFTDDIARCKECSGVIKPDVVFFGEPVKHLDACGEMVGKSDLLFILGSSLVVTPAALLPSLARGKIIVVNQGEVSEAFMPAGRIDLFADREIDGFFKAVNEHLQIME